MNNNIDPKIISSYNYAHLENIVIENAGFATNQEEIKFIRELVHQVAKEVLGKDKFKSYFVGNKPLSDRQITKIRKKVAKNFRLKRYKELRKKDIFSNHLIRKIREKAYPLQVPVNLQQKPEVLEQQKAVLKQKQEMLNDYYHMAGYTIAYRDLAVGTVIPGPHPELPNYKVDRVIQNDKGLQIVVLLPEEPAADSPQAVPPSFLAPIFCCRGTVFSDSNILMHNLKDDLHENIGQYSFQASKEKIAQALMEITDEHGPVVITGHSLGGALAQVITAEFCDQVNKGGQHMIKTTYHYNAPGVGKKVAEEYQAKINRLQAEGKPVPNVIEYYDPYDPVHLAGEMHLPTKNKYRTGNNRLSKSLSVKQKIATHSYKTTLSATAPKLVGEPSRHYRIVRFFTNTLRELTVIKIICSIYSAFKASSVLQASREANAQDEKIDDIFRSFMAH